ncbi:MAG: ABC transporter substrate-binding protein, partial [Deinococcus sp.]|nr:ABC transporter substrate-binding protein [Deinococcus sp.]
MRIVLLALAVGTLGLVSGVAQPGAVRLGVFGDLAGPAAFLGQALLDGTTLAVEQINAQGGISGRQLELVVRDASTSDRAVQAVEELIFTEEVLLLFGGTNTTPTAATLDTVEESGVPLYIPVATGDILTNPWRHNVFRASISDAFTPFLLVRYIADTFAGRRVGLMFESTGYGTGGASRVRLGLRTFNLALVAEVSYNQGDRNFVAQIQTLAQAGVEVLVFYGLTPEAIPALLTAQQLGFLPTVVASAGVVAGLPRDFFALAAAFNLVAPVFVVNPPQVGQPQFDNPQLAALRQ